MRSLQVLLLFFVAWTCAGCAESPSEPIALTGETMGTTYTIKVTELPDGATATELQSEIDAALEKINDQMSNYRPDSEISRFNHYEKTDWFAVSAETAEVVALALEISEATDGAFDVTVSSLVDLWSFGPEARPQTVPSDEEIEAARQRIGYDKIEVRKQPSPAMRKLAADVELNLSAIAKGYAVDEVSRILERNGIDDYMVEIGGEIRTRGVKANGTDWVLGIERPDESVRTVYRAVTVRDRAMATSGDYRNYFEVDGVRYSHTIDPRTGRPVNHRLASVTVLHDDCAQADALATALMVMGPDAGFQFAEREGLAVLMVVRTNDGFEERTTPSFESLSQPKSPAESRDESGITTFLFAAIVFGVAILGMAIGVIFAGKRLRGTCGGLAGLQDEHGQTVCESCQVPSDSCRGVQDGRRRSE